CADAGEPAVAVRGRGLGPGPEAGARAVAREAVHHRVRVIDRIDQRLQPVAGAVRRHVRLKDADPRILAEMIEAHDERARYATSTRRSRSASISPAMGTRTCAMLSRSRIVTASSASTVWKSMVTQSGVPTSSWRR